MSNAKAIRRKNAREKAAAEQRPRPADQRVMVVSFQGDHLSLWRTNETAISNASPPPAATPALLAKQKPTVLTFRSAESTFAETMNDAQRLACAVLAGDLEAARLLADLVLLDGLPA